jgi:hypothetical protein
MRAMVFDRYGDPDVMRLRDVPVPEPQDVSYNDASPALTLAGTPTALARTDYVRDRNRIADQQAAIPVFEPVP